MDETRSDDSVMLSRAIDVYFEAKALLFRDDPSFRIIRVGPLTCLHRHPGWSEVDAFYAVGVAPTDIVDAVRGYGPHPSHMIEVLTTTPEALWEPFGRLGYVPMSGTQPFLGRVLPRVPAATQNESVIEQRSTATASEYWIEREGQPVCCGKSVTTSQRDIYVYGMGTLPAYRRQGLAVAVLERIHADAGVAGAKISVLCSSKSGFPLYQKAGYDLLAHMQGLVPQNRADPAVHDRSAQSRRNTDVIP